MAQQRESRWVKTLTATIVRPILRGVTKAEWHGAENIPREGGVIIAANHLSMADPLTIAKFLYVAGKRWPTFTAKESVFRIPVVRGVANKTGQIPVKRGSTDAVKALKAAEEALARDGSAVIIYPEGTCTRDPDLWPMVAKTGVARLALAAGVPVVPLAHWGEQDLLPYGTAKLRPFPRKRVRIAAGPPVDLSRYRDQPLTATVLSDATTDIMRQVTQLQAGIRGEEPPAAPFDPKQARRDKHDTEGTGGVSADGDENGGQGTAPDVGTRE
ncbi:1-acyl-sn-glycerol-3-phosphate acyltransferase [Haloactinospora alba]|uniref:1-acyl-sn-glycerol-3-phosphate acyltransferase n=1 Tax=Haloactinospora alba TaxID=405555 RepID=A0A543NL75_9ACTN|nr:lysophospholipid acyltransferase family protein [Haloactinospora alba]TQN32547.1 1-acyl-sn-glycerol-3-phosphate acyltransferase [Haloactinospora alba]